MNISEISGLEVVNDLLLEYKVVNYHLKLNGRYKSINDFEFTRTDNGSLLCYHNDNYKKCLYRINTIRLNNLENLTDMEIDIEHYKNDNDYRFQIDSIYDVIELEQYASRSLFNKYLSDYGSISHFYLNFEHNDYNAIQHRKARLKLYKDILVKL